MNQSKTNTTQPYGFCDNRFDRFMKKCQNCNDFSFYLLLKRCDKCKKEMCNSGMGCGSIAPICLFAGTESYDGKLCIDCREFMKRTYSTNANGTAIVANLNG